jgi:thiamine pyrophosphokinase
MENSPSKRRLPAARHALVLVGSFQGARTDHALSHLLQAVTLAERGLNVVLTSGTRRRFRLLPGSLANSIFPPARCCR